MYMRDIKNIPFYIIGIPFFIHKNTHTKNISNVYRDILKIYKNIHI